MPIIQIIYASTSGHTEYVVQELMEKVRGTHSAASGQAPYEVRSLRVELAKPEDLLNGDVLILASSTWNTGGIEGQLNPYMDRFLKGSAKDFDLKGKKVALIALGDHRYRYTANAGVHLEEFVKTHGGNLIGEQLRIVNEPYGQENLIEDWAKKFLSLL